MTRLRFPFDWTLVVGTLWLAGLLCTLPAHAQSPADSTYTVRPGDTLYSIAQQVGVTVPTLQAWNDLDGTALQVGQTLRLYPPTTGEPLDTVEPPPLGSWTVKPGDTFVHIALRLGTTADTLFALNDSTTAPLDTGRTLHLPPRFGPPTHVVQPGETIYSIAGTYGVSLRTLRQRNDLDTTGLRPGQRLRLPDRSPPARRTSPAAPDTTGSVAVYPAPFTGRLMASGAAYDPEAFVGSHPTLPFGSVVLLSNPSSNTHTFVRIADRGPLDDSLLMDVSAAVADALQVSDGARNQSLALRVVWVASPR